MVNLQFWNRPKTSKLLPSRSTDGHFVELDGGHTDADGDGLAVFAAGADAFVELEVVAYHRDVLEGFGAIPD